MSDYDETQELRNEHQSLSSGVIQRLKQLPIRTRLGLLRGFDKAIAVAEKHVADKGEQWLMLSDDNHVEHMFDHVMVAFRRTADILSDDGLPELDKATVRGLFAIAKREGM